MSHQSETELCLFQPRTELPLFQILHPRHTQAVIQGAFVLAKAGNDPSLVIESLNHLDRNIRLLFGLHSAKNTVS